MKRFFAILATALLSLSAAAQTPAASTCPVTFLKVDPSGISTRIQNTSGKTIVGLTFYAALADATEHWAWVHYGFDQSGPLMELGWNKSISPMASKSLSWDRRGLDFEHGGGGAIVLTSALFSDGTSWEDPPDRSTCKALWYNSHKKSFVRPVELPVRPPS
jgi:hypothetical protein